MAKIILAEYAWIFAWWLSCWVIGLACIGLLEQRLDYGSKGQPGSDLPQSLPVELAIFYSFTTGLVLQIFVLIALALAGQLHAAAVIVSFGMLTIASLGSVLFLQTDQWRSRWFFLPTASEAWAVLPVFLLVGAWALLPLGPAMEHDELSYHLPYARFYLEQGELAVNEFLRYPLHTHNFNMLFTLALMRDSTSMAHLLHASAGFATLLAVHGIARRQYGSVTAFMAVLLCLSCGEFTRSFGNAYADLGLTIFVTAAAFALLEWNQRQQTSWLVLAAVFAGAAMGTKYFGLIFAALLGLWVLWSSRSVRTVLLFSLLAGLVGMFWYVRSWLISGNPVHPFLSDLFGYYIWSADNVTEQMKELQSHGVDRTWLNFFGLPGLFYLYAQRFHGYIRLDWLLMGLFYLAVLMSWRLARPWRPLIALSAVFLVFWFISAQVLRYLLPVVPFMALAGSASVTVLAGSVFSSLEGRMSGVWRASNLFVLPCLIGIALYYGARHWRVDLFWVPIKEEAQHQFLLENNPGYELFLAASEDPRIGKGPLLQLDLAGSYFYFPGTLYGDWNGPQSYFRYLELDAEEDWHVIPPGQMAMLLKEQGIRGVVFSYDEQKRFFPLDRSGYEQYFDLVFENRFGLVMVPRP